MGMVLCVCVCARVCVYACFLWFSVTEGWCKKGHRGHYTQGTNKTEFQ